jgi:hypothetical protein
LIRALPFLLLALVASACLDFDGALKDCQSKGLCPDSGAVFDGGAGGGGGALPLSLTAPSGSSFGSVRIGDGGTLPFVVTNAGTAGISDLSIASSSPTVFKVISSCGSTLASNSSCNLSVRFEPTASGTQTAQLTANGAGQTGQLTLDGIGITPSASFEVMPAEIKFPDTDIDGGVSTQALTVRNTGSLPLSNVTATIPGLPPSFLLKNNLCAGSAVGVGSSCTADVVFAPIAEGSWDASVAVTVQGLAGRSVPLAGLGYSGSSTYLLTVDIPDAGAPAGAVIGGPINCPPTCSAYVPRGVPVTLTAAPIPLIARFLGWDAGAGAGFSCDGGTCLFSALAPGTVQATFGRFNRMFITSVAVPGNLNRTSGTGVGQGDILCRDLAADAGLSNAADFSAWLSDSTTAASTRLGIQGLRGWVGLDGLPFADTGADLLAGKILYPITHNERGSRVLFAGVWTGTTAGGMKGGFTCSDWTSSAADAGTASIGDCGLTGEGGFYWSYGYNTFCTDLNRITCLEHRYNTPVPPRTAGRLAFISASSVSGDVTVAGADTVCQNEAQDAGLPNQFSALLHTGNSMGTGLAAAGGAWFRRDGVQLFQNPSDLFAPAGPDFLAPIAITATGAYLGYSPFFAWTGGVLARMNGNCQGWTNDAGTATVGFPARGGSQAIESGYTQNCSSSARLYCFER